MIWCMFEVDKLRIFLLSYTMNARTYLEQDVIIWVQWKFKSPESRRWFIVIRSCPVCGVNISQVLLSQSVWGICIGERNIYKSYTRYHKISGKLLYKLFNLWKSSSPGRTAYENLCPNKLLWPPREVVIVRSWQCKPWGKILHSFQNLVLCSW